MTTYSPHSYREIQVLTATPQRLRLMLIEGAIRFAREAITAWEAKENERGYECIVQCRDIVVELISSIDQSASDLSRQVAAVFAFLYHDLTLANLDRDRSRLEGVIRVLEEERLTWQALCEKMPEAPEGWQRLRTTGVVYDESRQAIPSSAR